MLNNERTLFCIVQDGRTCEQKRRQLVLKVLNEGSQICVQNQRQSPSWLNFSECRGRRGGKNLLVLKLSCVWAEETAKSNLYNCQQKLLEKVRLWGFPPGAVEYVKRWTITRNRSGNYSYQTPEGQRFTARDSVRELLQQMQKAGRFEGETFVLVC